MKNQGESATQPGQSHGSSGPPAFPAETLAVVYDCDGVLVDSPLANEAYYNYILSHFGLPNLHRDQLHMVQVLASPEVIDALFEGTGLAKEARLFERSLVDDRFLDLTTSEPHIIEVLKELRKGRWTAVVSNRGKSLRPLLAHHGLEELFDIVVASDEVERRKPDPESLERIIGHFRIVQDQVLYIGDSEIDQLLCLRARVPFVSYKNPELDALFNLDDHMDLLKILSHQIEPQSFRGRDHD